MSNSAFRGIPKNYKRFRFQTKRYRKVLTTILFYHNLSTESYNYDMLAFIYFYLHNYALLTTTSELNQWSYRSLHQHPNNVHECSNVHKCPNSTRVIHPQPMKYINEIIIIHVKHILFLTVLIIVFTN